MYIELVLNDIHVVGKPNIFSTSRITKTLKTKKIKTIKLKIPIFAKNILRGLNQEKNNSES